MSGNENLGNSIDHALENKELHQEFGGSVGVVFIMISSHLLLYYMWMAWRFHDGAVFWPHWPQVWTQLSTYAAPTWQAWLIYGGFLLLQAALYAWLPGLKVKGMPVPSQNNQQLEYRCNGIYAWYLTLLLVGVLHFSGALPLTRIADQFGSLMTVAIISGNVTALLTYFGAKATGNTLRMSGNFFYDFFMGAWLNPRIGVLDLKMWAEIRVAWILLFLLTLSAAAKQYATYGTITTPMIFMLLAHGLYTNACMKGEECIPTTWDIFYEKWGWMLIYWNFAGVPFLYSFNSMFIASQQPFHHSLPYTMFCFVLLLGAYYIWDTSQSQRNRFRMQQRGTFIHRRAFPQLPWGTLKNPQYHQTEHGNKLLTDGWWRYARKIHYTGDVLMALSWGLICGFSHYLPYFYVTFFVIMIAHRSLRDISRCRQKYGDDWKAYTQKVPYLFVPFLW